MNNNAARIFSAIRHDPTAILSAIWRHLEEAVTSGTAAWHLGVFGTTDLAGDCDLRTVVLRQVDTATRRLFIHADRRSPKISQLQRSSRVAWLFYDPLERVQLRIKGTATIHTDDALAAERWSASTLDSRRCYLAPAAPGTAFGEPFINLPEHLLHGPPTLPESVVGRTNFAAVATTVESLDWYALFANGHLRLRFTWTGSDVHWNWLAS